MTRLSGRRAAAVALGAVLTILGILEFLSMQPSVIADTLQNAEVMSAILGVQFFSALLLMVYGIVVVRSSN